MSELCWLNGKPNITAQFKVVPEDFLVQEERGFEASGDGEHVLLYVRKTGLNTLFVAENLARFSGIPARQVSYAGLKDRHAVTEQWFGLHMPGQETPDFSQFNLPGCEILQIERHNKKLRIGALKGNYFTLVLRNIDDLPALQERLEQVKHRGVANYFGEQRFGRDGNNLVQAQRWAINEIKVKDRNKKSFYLSAARSALFNCLVSERIKQNLQQQVLAGDILQLTGRGSWFVADEKEIEQLQQRLDNNELQITAPLAGADSQPIFAFEKCCFEHYDDFFNLFKREKVESARRAILVKPLNIQWTTMDEHTLKLAFWLPAGCFATVVLRELFNSSEVNEN